MTEIEVLQQKVKTLYEMVNILREHVHKLEIGNTYLKSSPSPYDLNAHIPKRY